MLKVTQHSNLATNIYIYIYIYIYILASLLLTLFIIVTPAHAETNKYEAHISDALKITIPSNLISITVDPSSQPFSSSSFNITVATNNLTGYCMTMSSDSTGLIKTDDSSKTIPTLDTLEGGYTESTFTTNRWGYKIGAGNYNSFVSGAEIARSDTTTNSDTTTLTFATKVDFLQSAGVYQTELNFTAVANPLPDPDITFATYMQDVTPAMAEATAIGTSKTLKDKRDDEEYLVEKLADGNIWMLDNLRLDPTTVSLETLQGNTNATDSVLTYLKNGGGSSPYPASGVSSGWSSSSQDKYDLPYINTSYKNTVASVTYGSGSGKIGVYYNYCAASAGSYCYAGGAGTGNAAYDICPKNWRLPVGGTTSDTTNEFNNLYVAYGSDHTAFKEALSTPLSGGFYSRSAYNQGSYGYFWSSTFYNTYSMRGLGVNSSGVYPDGGDGRYSGFSVRCVVK